MTLYGFVITYAYQGRIPHMKRITFQFISILQRTGKETQKGNR